MSKPLNPQRRIVGGRAVVNRDWIREFTGASAGTAARWYKIRLEQPEEHRHPEKERIDGADFYDEQQFRDFYTWFQQEKASKVLKADPELYELDPETVVSINKAAELLNFSGASVIRKYQQANPGYFPDSVGEVEGPTGRMIQAFRVGDLQDFDRKRTGDRLGKAGRRPGPQPGAAVGRPSALEEVLAAELSARADGEPLTATQLAEQFAAERIERDGYHPGLAAELSVQYGGPQRAWEYAVRKALEHHPAAAPNRSEAADRRAAIALAAMSERGDVRGLAADLAREHGGSRDVWERAVKAARNLAGPTV
ncbi:hypothetical protein AQJ11_37405 [Streptomyces corchorusii]|uniref:Uncharacterized protein n=2 Tax=Streptomyces TaxID=1883 RepID=A0A101PTU4_STRCK|nr:hypothetical protein [Streptomyces corchorusii]KUN17551.1 hypothetical protein AQJ11_37405 [Streptomyces corchorusii]